MGTSSLVHVQLEIGQTAGTINGQVTVEDAPATPFYGWLELIDRLERATNPDPAAEQEPRR